MMDNKSVKRISTLLLVCMLMASMVVTAFADVSDKKYDTPYSIPANAWTSTERRYKENNSKVYVAPEYSPNARTKVKTMCNVGGIASNKTKNSNEYVMLTDGTKYAITNFVYEHGDYTTTRSVHMWLSMSPPYGRGMLRGVWSPDWSGTGVVTIV